MGGAARGGCPDWAEAEPAISARRTKNRNRLMPKYTRSPKAGPGTGASTSQSGEEVGRFERLAEAGAEAGAPEFVLAPAVHVRGHRDHRRAGTADGFHDGQAVEIR